MRTPLTAVWPPILLLFADFGLLSLSLTAGWYILATLLVAGAAILLFDIRGRGRDYRAVREFVSSGKDPALIAHTYRFSWCGRVACEAAARDTSSSAAAAVRRYYRMAGYRWFHVFPDNTFTRRSPFLSPKFWSVTVFGNRQAQTRIESGKGEIIVERMEKKLNARKQAKMRARVRLAAAESESASPRNPISDRSRRLARSQA
jgi:hypothetical protein